MTARRRTYRSFTAVYLERLVQRVAAFYEVDPAALLGRIKTPDVVLPRHAAFYIADRADIGRREVARFFCRNNSTVLYGVRRIERAMKRDPLIRQDIADLSRSQEVAA